MTVCAVFKKVEKKKNSKAKNIIRCSRNTQLIILLVERPLCTLMTHSLRCTEKCFDRALLRMSGHKVSLYLSYTLKKVTLLLSVLYHQQRIQLALLPGDSGIHLRRKI